MDRWIFRYLAIVLLAGVPLTFIHSPVQARVVAIAAVCLYFWISESAPPFVPTLMLWAAVPLFLSPLDTRFAISSVLTWGVDPVMALFFGGFALGVATSVYAVDSRLANFALRSAGGSFPRFLLFAVLITAFLSMWMSNIAAAAMILACLRPILKEFRDDHLIRRTLLLGVALSADLGGMATPIGTGPNAIAIASISQNFHVSFLDWMIFAFPLTIGMLLLAYLMLLFRGRSEQRAWSDHAVFLVKRASGATNQDIPDGQWKFFTLIALTILLWLTEPLHHIPSSVVAIAAAAVLFSTGMLQKKDLIKIDWSTLMLIAGGITLGRLIEQSGLITSISSALPVSEWNATMALFVLCLASALLSALMSNTATAVMLIPLATAVVPVPSTAILIAISASFGIPFVISTPQNAMAYGEGGLRFNDLFTPGIVIMILGCAIVSLTGRHVLNFVGIP